MKKHVRRTVGHISPMCNVGTTDASLQFIDDKFRKDKSVLGQASTCQRCAKKAVREANNG